MAAPSLHRLQVLAAALLFSTGGTVIKASSLSAWQIACFRSGLAAVALAIAVPSWRRCLRPPIVAVGAAYAATMILFVAGNKLTTAASTIFLQSTAPMYLLLLGPWLLREHLKRGDRSFLLCMAAGMLLLFVGHDSPQQTAPDPALGNMLAAASGLTWALTLVGLRRLGRGAVAGSDDAGAAVVIGNTIACVFCLPFVWPLSDSGLADWVIVGYLGLFQIGLAYVWLTRGVRHLPALETSLLLLLEPVLSSCWAWIFHGESVGPASLAGCAILFGATLLRTLRRR